MSELSDNVNLTLQIKTSMVMFVHTVYYIPVCIKKNRGLREGRMVEGTGREVGRKVGKKEGMVGRRLEGNGQ